MPWMKFRIGVLTLTLGMLAASHGRAMASFELSTDRFGFSGTYTRYATQADAEAGTGAIATGTVEQRDMSLALDDNASYITTAWWYTQDSQGRTGWGNPSNTNLSFLQIYDPPSVTANGYWTSGALNEFRITASGSDSTVNARFGTTDTAAADSRGQFLSYSLDATFSGLNTAVDTGSNTFRSTGDPNGIAVNGTFTALFQNTSTSNPSLNGFYVVNLTLNSTSWVYDNQNSLTGDASYSHYQPSVFESSVVAPEPSTLGLAGMGVMAALIHARRRRRAS